MECLFEFFVEVIGEFVIEGIMYLYMWMMNLIIPGKMMSPKTEKRIRRIVTCYAAILIIALIVGAVILAATDLVILGRYLTFIPLSLIALQFVLGIAFRIFLRAKKMK